LQSAIITPVTSSFFERITADTYIVSEVPDGMNIDLHEGQPSRKAIEIHLEPLALDQLRSATGGPEYPARIAQGRFSKASGCSHETGCNDLALGSFVEYPR
jgi:hypothetical protein